MQNDQNRPEISAIRQFTFCGPKSNLMVGCKDGQAVEIELKVGCSKEPLLRACPAREHEKQKEAFPL